jgi:pyrroline-5-carboxylate reductase
MSKDSTQALAAIPGTILLAGAGKMGSAMLTGWLNAGVALGRLAVIEPHLSDDLRKLAALDLRINPTRDEAGQLAALVVAVKPQTFGEAATLLKTYTSPATLVVSIMAGMTIGKIGAGCGGAVVRAMPNTPAAIGRGMTVAVAAPAVSAEQRAFARNRRRRVGWRRSADGCGDGGLGLRSRLYLPARRRTRAGGHRRGIAHRTGDQDCARDGVGLW